MIPKVINYCWFGGNALSDKEIECINSWKKYCPDYKIIRWDETNFDITSNRYISEAYAKGKWAFVSDYARFKILYENGGLYFDTDVEIIRPIDDIVLRGPFFGLEHTDHELGDMCINPGLVMGACKGECIYKEIIDHYDAVDFDDACDFTNTKTVVEIVTELFLKYGFCSSCNIQQIEGFYLYPPEYFSPMDYKTGLINITNNTRSIHRYSGTWLSPEAKKIQNARYRLVRIFGRRIGVILSDAHGVFVRLFSRIRKKGVASTLRFYIDRIRSHYSKPQ